MIALLAAVAEETVLIREALKDCTSKTVHGMPLLTGRIHGQEVCLAHGGVGKAAAAAATVSLMLACQPEALLLFGCGGAYPNSGLDIGDLALADSEVFGDEGVATRHGFEDLEATGLPMRKGAVTYFNRWPTDPRLQERAQAVLIDQTGKNRRKLAKGAFVTVSTCTGTTAAALDIEARTGGICENMEGAAVALACQQLSVPLLEIRGISNRVEDRDTSRWDLASAMAAAQEAVMILLEKWPGR